MLQIFNAHTDINLSNLLETSPLHTGYRELYWSKSCIDAVTNLDFICDLYLTASVVPLWFVT